MAILPVGDGDGPRPMRAHSGRPRRPVLRRRPTDRRPAAPGSAAAPRRAGAGFGNFGDPLVGGAVQPSSPRVESTSPTRSPRRACRATVAPIPSRCRRGGAERSRSKGIACDCSVARTGGRSRGGRPVAGPSPPAMPVADGGGAISWTRGSRSVLSIVRRAAGDLGGRRRRDGAALRRGLPGLLPADGSHSAIGCRGRSGRVGPDARRMSRSTGRPNRMATP